jgi:hypothetical protein
VVWPPLEGGALFLDGLGLADGDDEDAEGDADGDELGEWPGVARWLAFEVALGLEPGVPVAPDVGSARAARSVATADAPGVPPATVSWPELNGPIWVIAAIPASTQSSTTPAAARTIDVLFPRGG